MCRQCVSAGRHLLYDYNLAVHDPAWTQLIRGFYLKVGMPKEHGVWGFRVP